MDVDELGTVAAAATAACVVLLSYPPQPVEPMVIVFDRPFVFVVRHNASHVPVFIGAVQAPPAV